MRAAVRFLEELSPMDVEAAVRAALTLALNLILTHTLTLTLALTLALNLTLTHTLTLTLALALTLTLTHTHMRAAVRLLEELSPVDVEAAVRAALDKMTAGGGGEGDSWHVDEMVRRKDEAEAAAEDSEDQGLVVGGARC